jgi:steroid delta-isomerase-like uncharacterized protein
VSEHNRKIARRAIDEIWNSGDFSSVDELIGDSYHHRSNQIPPLDGVEALKDLVAGIREGFPDGRFTVDEEVADGNTVVHRWTFRGTHLGVWAGISGTGKKVEVTGTGTNHFEGGKIVEHLADWDAMGMMQQVGAIEM